MKKAWERDYEFLCGAVPVKNRTDTIQWDGILEGKMLKEAQEKLELGKGWWLKPLPESKAPYSKMLGAISCMENMGYDVSEAEKLVESAFAAIDEDRLIDVQIINARVFKALAEAKKVPDHPYWSHTIYESFEQYRSAVRFETYPDYRLPDDETLYRQIHAGWLGEIIGSALGTAVEGFQTDRLFEVFGEIDGYVKPPETMNDDITFELVLLKAFAEKGYAISSDDIADKWVGLIPFAYTAEGVALNHLCNGIYPPTSGHLVNPYREMIGAAMRAAICGVLAPGRPELAADLAWRDGCISHHNNGILAEVFNAVIVSMAYVEKDMRTVLEKAIQAIPADSEIYTVLDFAREACKKCATYREALKMCEERYKHYNWVHSYYNMCAEVIAITFAGNDFSRCMTILMMAGQDNDCTGGPIGHAYGVMLGEEGIGERFIAPLQDRLDTYVRTMETQKISDLSRDTLAAILRHWHF